MNTTSTSQDNFPSLPALLQRQGRMQRLPAQPTGFPASHKEQMGKAVNNMPATDFSDGIVAMMRLGRIQRNPQTPPATA